MASGSLESEVFELSGVGVSPFCRLAPVGVGRSASRLRTREPLGVATGLSVFRGVLGDEMDAGLLAIELPVEPAFVVDFEDERAWVPLSVRDGFGVTIRDSG